jgi:hypothetical protein
LELQVVGMSLNETKGLLSRPCIGLFHPILSVVHTIISSLDNATSKYRMSIQVCFVLNSCQEIHSGWDASQVRFL